MAEQSSLTRASDMRLARGAQVSAILAVGAAEAFHAETVALHEKTTAAQALVAIGTSCVRQIALNEPGVRGGSSEAVHQMRIGLRRLRAAMSLFKPVLGPCEFDDLKRELVWLTEQLTDARDLDVLSESVRRLGESAHATWGADSELADELKRRRQRALAVATCAAESVRFRQIIVSSAVSLISWVDEDGKGQRRMRDLAREILEHRTRRVLRRLAGFSQLDALERHQLRIYVKKLRYGAEFFASLFPGAGRSRKRFVRALETLQDALGRMNDIAVHQRIARTLVDDEGADGRARRRIAFAIGGLIASERAELTDLSWSMAKLRKRFSRAPRFWR